jgi:hypothetical protein
MQGRSSGTAADQTHFRNNSSFQDFLHKLKKCVCNLCRYILSKSTHVTQPYTLCTSKALFCRGVLNGFVRVLFRPNPIHQETLHHYFVGWDRSGKARKIPGKHVGLNVNETCLRLTFCSTRGIREIGCHTQTPLGLYSIIPSNPPLQNKD